MTYVRTIIKKGSCFTIESNIRGLKTQEIEARLGFRKGRLTLGARVFALDKEPGPEEYEAASSTLYPKAKGLDAKELEVTKARPGAWLGERIVKVVPDLPHSEFEWYPPVHGIAAEQWILKKDVIGYEVCRLAVGETYWGR